MSKLFKKMLSFLNKSTALDCTGIPDKVATESIFLIVTVFDFFHLTGDMRDSRKHRPSLPIMKIYHVVGQMFHLL